MESADLFGSSGSIESEEDSNLLSPSLLNGVTVTDSDWTAETILSQVGKGNILLNPRFQRRETWDDERKSRFIESLVLGLPVPQLVLAEVRGLRGKYLVIDGKQRLLALMKFASNGVDKNLKLKGLDIRPDLNGLTWNGLKNSSELQDDATAFENSQIRTTVIRGWQDERVLYLIFHRLNSGSVPLSPQELRHVLHPGGFIDFAFDYTESSPVLINIFGSDGKADFRMRDVELMIRFFGFHYYIDAYDGDLKEFLDFTVKSLNREWPQRGDEINNVADQFQRSVELVVEIFDDAAFAKWTSKGVEKRFNRAVFDVMTYYFSDMEVVDAINSKNHKKEIVSLFRELCVNDIRFLRSLETTTKSSQAVVTRLVLWGRQLQSFLGVQISKLSAVEARAKKYAL